MSHMTKQTHLVFNSVSAITTYSYYSYYSYCNWNLRENFQNTTTKYYLELWLWKKYSIFWSIRCVVRRYMQGRWKESSDIGLIITKANKELSVKIIGKFCRKFLIVTIAFMVTKTLMRCMSIDRKIFFFYLGFLSRTFTNHRTAGEGGGHFFNSSLPLSPASLSSWVITAESSPLHIASSRTRTGNFWFPSASR